ncbi:MAG: hypothetical protein AAGB11_13140 [Pseudomonadota bacterium]
MQKMGIFAIVVLPLVVASAAQARPYVLETRDKKRCTVNGICGQDPFSDLPGFGD